MDKIRFYKGRNEEFIVIPYNCVEKILPISVDEFNLYDKYVNKNNSFWLRDGVFWNSYNKRFEDNAYSNRTSVLPIVTVKNMSLGDAKPGDKACLFGNCMWFYYVGNGKFIKVSDIYSFGKDTDYNDLIKDQLKTISKYLFTIIFHEAPRYIRLTNHAKSKKELLNKLNKYDISCTVINNYTGQVVEVNK